MDTDSNNPLNKYPRINEHGPGVGQELRPVNDGAI
jgi:hypothetical protein